jgi:2-dehydrotetronate isomerase
LRFSANLGFLWSDLSQPDAIRAAKKAGFDAVECHWPYATDPGEIRAALDETRLNMLAINTLRGRPASGDFGLCALPGREPQARDALDQAIRYATGTGTKYIHVLAGNASGPAARNTFVDNLRYGLEATEHLGITLLIEPLNRYDAPGYFLNVADQAVAIIAQIGSDRLQLMFDCYHMQIIHGDISRLLQRLLPLIGHIQIAAVPDRGEPDRGELNYRHVLRHLDQLGYTGFIGAEYRPRTTTNAGLGWLADFRR